MRLSTIPLGNTSTPPVDAVVRASLTAGHRFFVAVWRQRRALAVVLAVCVGTGFSAPIAAALDAMTSGLLLSGNWLGGVDPVSFDFLVGALQAHVA